MSHSRLFDREVQGVVNRRQRDVHDRRVENDHELGAGDHREGEAEVLAFGVAAGQFRRFSR